MLLGSCGCESCAALATGLPGSPPKIASSAVQLARSLGGLACWLGLAPAPPAIDSATIPAAATATSFPFIVMAPALLSWANAGDDSGTVESEAAPGPKRWRRVRGIRPASAAIPKGDRWGSVYVSGYRVCPKGHALRDNPHYPQRRKCRGYPRGSSRTPRLRVRLVRPEQLEPRHRAAHHKVGQAGT